MDGAALAHWTSNIARYYRPLGALDRDDYAQIAALNACRAGFTEKARVQGLSRCRIKNAIRDEKRRWCARLRPSDALVPDAASIIDMEHDLRLILSHMSERQLDIINRMAHDESKPEIAKALHISRQMLHLELTDILRKAQELLGS